MPPEEVAQLKIINYSGVPPDKSRNLNVCVSFYQIAHNRAGVCACVFTLPGTSNRSDLNHTQ